MVHGCGVEYRKRDYCWVFLFIVCKVGYLLAHLQAARPGGRVVCEQISTLLWMCSMKNIPANDWDLSNYDLSEYTDEEIEAIIWHVRRFKVVPGYLKRNLKQSQTEKPTNELKRTNENGERT